MYILGISAFYHDSAACLLKDDHIVAAVQEERFTRIKNDAQFPVNAIKYCLQEAAISLHQVDHVVFYEKPFLKFERLVETYLAMAPKGIISFLKAMPLWIKSKIFQKRTIIDHLTAIDTQWVYADDKLLFTEHHQSHAASAFFPSPYKKALIITADGVGEWATTSVWMGEDNRIELLKEIKFPHSIGLLYSAFTYYLGFKVNSDEYKVMGLAPYGEPIYLDPI
jgi:carbamoyltransferase